MVTPVRPLRREDLEAVAALEARANPAPWQAGDFLSFAQAEQGGAESGARRMAWVYPEAEGRAGVLGFACASAAADEAELLSIAVEDSARRRGVGSALMAALIEWARREGMRVLHLEVREGNGPAQALYRKHGFVPVGRRRGYYADTGEDALLMALGSVPTPPRNS